MKNLKMMSKKSKMIIAGALAAIVVVGVGATVMYKRAEEKKAIALEQERLEKEALEKKYEEERLAKEKQEEEERLAAEKEAEELRIAEEEAAKAKAEEEAKLKAEEEAKQQANNKPSTGNTSNNKPSTGGSNKPSTGGSSNNKPSTGGGGGTTEPSKPTPPPTNNFKPAGFDQAFTNDIFAWGVRTSNFTTEKNRPQFKEFSDAIKAHALNGTAIPQHLFNEGSNGIKAVKVITKSITLKYVAGQDFRDYDMWSALNGCDYISPGDPGVQFKFKYVTAHHDGKGNVTFKAYNLGCDRIK